MPDSITVTLPSDLKTAVDDTARREGISTDELIGRAVKEHVFLRQFRLLRDRLVPQAEAQGIRSDVFDRVS